jgi:hypothetical protein
LVAVILVGVLGLYFVRVCLRAARKAEFVTLAKGLACDIHRSVKRQQGETGRIRIDHDRLVGEIETAETGLVREDDEGNILDPWDSPLRIRIWMEGERLHVRVDSNGPDRREETADDVYKEESFRMKKAKN